MRFKDNEEKYEQFYYDIQADILSLYDELSSIRTTVSLSSETLAMIKSKKLMLEATSSRKTQKAMIDHILWSFMMAEEENLPIHFLPDIETHKIEKPTRRSIVMTQRSHKIASILAKELKVSRDVVIDFVLNKHCKINLFRDDEMNEELAELHKIISETQTKIDVSNLFLLAFNALDDGKNGINKTFTDFLMILDELKELLEKKSPDLTTSYEAPKD